MDITTICGETKRKREQPQRGFRVECEKVEELDKCVGLSVSGRGRWNERRLWSGTHTKRKGL